MIRSGKPRRKYLLRIVLPWVLCTLLCAAAFGREHILLISAIGGICFGMLGLTLSAFPKIRSREDMYSWGELDRTLRGETHRNHCNFLSIKEFTTSDKNVIGELWWSFREREAQIQADYMSGRQGPTCLEEE